MADDWMEGDKMSVRFRPDSDEMSCGKTILKSFSNMEFTCLRIAGHDGACVADMADAAFTDGVYPCCRMKVSGAHRAGCWIGMK